MSLSSVPLGQDIGQYDGSGDWVKLKTFGYEIRPELELPYWLGNAPTSRFNSGNGTPNLPERVSSCLGLSSPRQTEIVILTLLL